MAWCGYVDACPFFRDEMGYSPELAERTKDAYCRGDWAACARYIVFREMGPEHLPDDLFPAESDRLDAIRAAAADQG